MHKIKLTDETGSYWLGVYEEWPCWFDDQDLATPYDSYEAASAALREFNARKRPDWFPSTEIVRFK